VTRPDSTRQARFAELVADPMGEPDPVLDRLTYHRAPAAAPHGGPADARPPGTEAEWEAEAGQ
jgi:hypothetical protein